MCLPRPRALSPSSGRYMYVRMLCMSMHACMVEVMNACLLHAYVIIHTRTLMHVLMY